VTISLSLALLATFLVAAFSISLPVLTFTFTLTSIAAYSAFKFGLHVDDKLTQEKGSVATPQKQEDHTLKTENKSKEALVFRNRNTNKDDAKIAKKMDLSGKRNIRLSK
jgi:hypothetical protein